MLNPLTINNHQLKDSFDAAQRIKTIPNDLYNDGYVLVSFDVVSLFTNVPLKRTVDIILRRIYEEKQITTNLKKRTLKKLIMDTCSKTAFTCCGKIYEQYEGVSMGASLGPVLANIIMTELEQKIVDQLISDDIIKFYGRYVDDTIILVKPENIEEVLRKFNSFDKNLQFTVDKFENETPHFLDLEIHPDGLTIYRKDTHTGQFVNFSSYTKWNYKIAWIRALIHRAKKLCSENKILTEIKNIKLFAAYNGYPKQIVNSVLKKCRENENKQRDDEIDDSVVPQLYLKLPYQGINGEKIVKKMKRKLRHCLKKDLNVSINVYYSTTKISYYTSTKDHIPKLSNSGVVYEYVCPGCLATYIGETQATLFKRTLQHSHEQKDSAIYKHLLNCNGYKHITSLFKIEYEEFDEVSFKINSVRENTKIINRSRDWVELCFKEAIAIKTRNPNLNNGLKATKSLQLF